MLRRSAFGGADIDFGCEECSAAVDGRFLLTDETLTLENLPRLADIATLSSCWTHGVTIEVNGGNGPNKGRIAHFHAADIADTTAPYDLVRKMRATCLSWGRLLRAAVRRGSRSRAVRHRHATR